jgi:acyl-coenzyme A synthetase/AMP-(fatty) acid ligase
MHVGHLLTRAAQRWPLRPAWLEGDVVEFVPELPKNAYGKILKRELREQYWVGRDRRV